MIDNITTVRADSVEEAIELALSQLNLSREEVDVHIISEGKKGFLGFGKQPAVVEVSAKDLTVSDVAKQVVEEVVKTSKSASQETPKASIEVEEIVDEETSEETVTVEETVTYEAVEPVEVEPQEEVIEEPVQEKKKSTVKDKDGYEIVKSYLEDILTAYGVKDTRVTYDRQGTQVTFDIHTDKPGIVIGRQGRNLNALQVVAQILFHRYEPRRLSIILNVGNYRERRENVLTKMAQRAARQVQETKQDVILEPLPAYERKQIHAIISRYDDLTTKSEGKDPNRYLIVQYNG